MTLPDRVEPQSFMMPAPRLRAECPDVRRARHLRVNEEIYHLVEEPGLKPPSKRLTYASPNVQEVVCRIFGNLLPRIIIDENGKPYHELLDDDGRDLCLESRAVMSLDEIPSLELFTLEEATACLRGIARNAPVAENVRRILVSFQLPDPKTNLPLYRLYQDRDGHTRLLVLWGFQDRRNTGKFMLATTAISMLKTHIDTTCVHHTAEHLRTLTWRDSEPLAFEDVAPKPPVVRPSPPCRASAEALIQSASRMWRRFAAEKLAANEPDQA